MNHVIHAGGAVIAEIDLEALYQRETVSADSVKLSSCPTCGCVPEIRKDSGNWYLVGNVRCIYCDHLWALLSEDDL